MSIPRRTSPKRRVLIAIVRLLMIVIMILPQVSYASAVSSTVSDATTGLVQGRNEDLDAYLRRVAAADPQLFQQASLAAVQDAFNGKLPEVQGEKSMESQIAYYLHLAATGVEPDRAQASKGTSSAINGDAYLWNGRQANEQDAGGSAWQMTARPGGDTAAFARNFETMLTADSLPQGIPGTVTGGPSQSMVNLPLAGPEARSSTTAAGSSVDAIQSSATVDAPLAQPDAGLLEVTNDDVAPDGDVTQLVAQRIQETQAEAAPAQAITKLAEQADLGASISAPITAAFEEVITYALAITNAGPALASRVQVTQTLPANGVFQPKVPGCAASGEEYVVCSVGALKANESISLSIPVKMKGNDVVTSTVTVVDLGGTIDPGGEPAEASAQTTVESDTRSEREVGNIVIAANDFRSRLGRVTASGAVEIGYTNDDKEIEYHLRLGPDDSLTWKNGEEVVNGDGTLSQIEEDFELFEGAFSIDASEDEPVITPADDATPKVEELAGFELVGTPVITQVGVLDGTAAVSATIVLGQAGVVTDTTETVVGVIKPGGDIEGTINKFEAVFAGLTVKVNTAVFSDDKITIKRARVTMPRTLGGLTGIITLMKVTATSIDFGGVGVKVPLPNIYPVGKPVGGTTPYTPTISFVDNSATFQLERGVYSLQVESTLRLSLPGNDKKIPVKFKLDSNGKLDGTIKEIKLTIAGQRLTMKGVKISTSSLSVAEATLTVQRGDPSKKASAKDASTLLSVTVKKVVIDRKGLAIGSAGITNTLPDIKVGSSATFANMAFTVTVKNPTTKPSFELDLKGKLKIHLAGNKQVVGFSAKIDSQGKLSGKVASLSLAIASSTLELTNVAFNAERLTAASASLTLPPLLGNAKATITRVVIDKKGLSFGDASVTIPVEFTIGKKDGEPDATNSLHVKGTLTLILAKDRTYGFAIKGTVTIKVAAQTAVVGGKFRMDNTGKMTGSVETFELTIAGMTLGVKEASIEDGVLKAAEATLAIPEEWGGLSATVYELEISDEGISIGGGSFKLPEIKVGDMRLSLEGTLKKEDGGWVIAAGGSLKLPNTGGGCSGIGVSVEIFAGSGQDVVMAIAPAAESDETSFELRKASVSLQCDVVLGASGFVLTAITGTVTLDDNVTRLDVKATIESQLRIGPFKAVTADGNMYMEYVKDPYKFEIGIGASMRIFSMFEAARASATLRFADGDVPFLFKAEMNINAVIARGEVKLTAWTSNGDFHLVGRIYGSVGLRRGAALDRCVDLGWFGEHCVTIPPEDLFIDATMEFGEFRHGDGSTWGLKASVEIAGIEVGIYVNTEGNFSVGNVTEYRTIDTPSLQRAQQLHALAQSGQLRRTVLTAAEQDLLQSYSFAQDGIAIDIAEVTKPGDLVVDTFLSINDADVQVTLVRPDGLRIAASNAPDNVTMRQEIVAATDPVTGAPNPAAPQVMNTNITINNAQLGTWKVFLSHQPTDPFGILTNGTIYGPPVEKLTVAGRNDTDNHVDLGWHQTTDVTSTTVIYATQEPITTTAQYTDTRTIAQPRGLTSTEVITVDAGVVTQFTGLPIAEYDNLTGSQALTRSIDLNHLKTGSYNLWLEVNDGLNPPTRQYFPGKVAVYHPWNDNWTANVRVTPGLGALTVAWNDNPNPDVDGYDIALQTAEGIYTVDAGDELSETITGLSAQETYTITVEAYNARTELVSVSESVTARPLSAPFTLQAAPSALTINGGSSGLATLTLNATADPYPSRVFLHLADLPDGLDVALASDVVTPTVAGAQVGLVITPTAGLIGGVYPVTVEAVSNGDARQVTIPVTVREPDFTPQVSKDALILPFNGSVAVDFDATYTFGEQDIIDVDVLEIPPGIDWSFNSQSLLPGEKATLVLTDTGYLGFGDYDVVVEMTDYQHTYEVVLPLTLSGFAVDTSGDSVALRSGEVASFSVALDGAAWSSPVNLTFDPQSVGNRFITTISRPSRRVPATVRVDVDPLPSTEPGIYELLLLASSNGITETLPLYVTVQEDRLATDMVMDYILPEEIFVVAGDVFTYTLAPRNISANPAEDVAVIDTMLNGDLLTLESSDGCSVEQAGSETSLLCELGTIPRFTQNQDRTVSWRVDPDAPDGAVLAQEGEVIVLDMVPHPETSTLDNLFGAEHVVVRYSDLRLQTSSTPAKAGELMTVTAMVTNAGPSFADDTVVDLYLPPGVSLRTASNGCVQDNELIQCPVGVLAPGEDASVVATLLVEPDYRGSLETLVDVTSASIDPNFDDNTDVVLADTTASAQLSLVLTPERTQAVEGDTVSYLISVTNQGPSTATGVSLSLSTPATSHVFGTQVGGADATFDRLKIEAGETLTATAAVYFEEDDHGQPREVRLVANALETTPVAVTSSLLRVANANPTAVLSDTVILEEGEVGIISAHTADPGGIYDEFDIAWDLDNDGDFDDSDQPVVRYDTLGMDGPRIQPIAVRVTDDDGGQVTATGTIIIRNVTPTVTIGSDPQYKRYDLPFDVSFQAYDPLAGDIQAARIDWGDGTVEQVPLRTEGRDEHATHSYTRIGKFTTSICVSDEGGEGCAEVVLQAACRDNGLLVNFTHAPDRITVMLENASGTVTIPAGMPFTLYNGDQAIHTFTLDQALAVGGSRTLQFAWPNLEANTSLRLVVDDNGTGAKATDLCSGAVSRSMRIPLQVFLPILRR